MKETESEFLIRHGWRLMQTTGFTGSGRTKYWDHPKYRRDDGMWWTQGSAYIHQRNINRQEGKKANS